MARWFSSRHWTCWHPNSWHGWLITIIYVALVLLIFFKIDLGSASIADIIVRMLLPFVLLSIVFRIICKKTSE